MTTTYRAAYWADGQTTVALTDPDQAHLSDDDLLAEARYLANDMGLETAEGAPFSGRIVIGDFTV